MRSFQSVVATYQLKERCVMTELRTIAMPARSMTAPTQSQLVHRSRQRRIQRPFQASPAAARANTAGMTPSSLRTMGAIAEATAAAAIHQALRVESAFTIRKRQSAEYG